MQATKIYVISLKRLPKRRKSMETQLAKLGLEAEFVEGVDGLELSEETLKANYTDQEEPQKMTPTEIACAWSHRNVYKRLINSEEKYALVLEDDAVLSPEIVPFLELIPKITSDWELISLFGANRIVARSYIFRSSFPLNLYNQHKLELGSQFRKYRLGELLLPIFGAVAYMVSRQGAHLFTHHNTPITSLADHIFASATAGKWLAVKPNLISHRWIGAGVTTRSYCNTSKTQSEGWTLLHRFLKYSPLGPANPKENKLKLLFRQFVERIKMTVLYLITGFKMRRK